MAAGSPIGLLLALTYPGGAAPPPVVVEPPPTGGFAPSGDRSGKVPFWWPPVKYYEEPKPRVRRRMRKPKQRAVIQPGPTRAVLAPLVHVIPPYESTQFNDFMGGASLPHDAVQGLADEHERAVREHRMRVEADDEAAVHRLLADDWRTMIDAYPAGAQFAREIDDLKAQADADWQDHEDEGRRAGETAQMRQAERDRAHAQAILREVQRVLARSRGVQVVRGPDGKIAGLANTAGEIVHHIVRDENGQVAGLE